MFKITLKLLLILAFAYQIAPAQKLTAPNIVAKYETIDFGKVWVGETIDTIIPGLLKNIGDEYWQPYYNTMDTVDFLLIYPKNSFILMPDDSIEFKFRCKPTKSGILRDRLGFSSLYPSPEVLMICQGLTVKFNLSKESINILAPASGSPKIYYDSIKITNQTDAELELSYQIVNANSDKIALVKDNPNDSTAIINIGDSLSLKVSYTTLESSRDTAMLKLNFKHKSEPVYIKISGETVLSVEETFADEINVFPNPTNNTLNISLSDGFCIKSSYSIIDVNGKVIRADEKLIENNINISELSAGIYFISFNCDNRQIVKKFVIQ